MTDGSEGTFDWVGGPDVLPVLRWEVIEGEQHVAVFDQFGCRPFVFHTVGLNEEFEGGIGFGLRFSLPDVMQMALGFGLDRLRHGIEHIAGSVEPAALFRRRAKDLAQGCPEAECAIAYSEIGRVVEAAPFEIEEQLAPALGAFAVVVRQAEDFFSPLLIRTDQHQNALFFFHSWLEIDTIGPDIDDAPGAEIAFLPALIIFPPVCFEPRNRRGRQARRIGPKSCGEGFLEVARGNTLEVKPGQQFLDGFGLAQIRRQDR